MAVPYISDSTFQAEVLNSDVPVLLDFTAVWCGPCKAIAPLLDTLAAEKAGQLKIVKIDVDANYETPNKFGVANIPTLLLFKKGQLVDRQVGAVKKPQLDSFVSKVL